MVLVTHTGMFAHARPRRRACGSLILAAAIGAACADPVLPAQDTRPRKPVVVEFIDVAGGPAPPATLAGLWQMSDLVVEGQLTGETSVDSGGLVQTLYEFEVAEEFKTCCGRPTPAARVRVYRFGGERDHGDHITDYVVEEFPKFRRNDRLVLFLKWGGGRTWGRQDLDFDVAATEGADSIFRITDGAVQAFGRSQLSRSLERHSRDEFLALLRMQGGQK